MALTPFDRAKAVIIGQSGVFIDRMEAQPLAEMLTPEERGVLLPLYWERFMDIFPSHGARSILCHSLERPLDRPMARFDAGSAEHALRALQVVASQAAQITRLQPPNSQFKIESWITNSLRLVVFRVSEALLPTAQAALQGLMVAWPENDPSVRFAMARMAGDQVQADAALLALVGLCKGNIEAREWGVIAAAAPLLLTQIVGARSHVLLLQADHESDATSALVSVPGYAAFAATVFAEAKTRLADIASGAAPYKADGAFVVDDCYTITRVVQFGLHIGADWCLNGLETAWLWAAVAPDPKAKTVPSQSLTIGFANASVAEPWPHALQAIRKVASTCRHAGLVKKLDRFKRSVQSALSAHPDRLLDLDPNEPLPKDLIRPFRDAVEGMLAQPETMPLPLWLARFGPECEHTWALAKNLIWDIAGADGLVVSRAMPVKSKTGTRWVDVTGVDIAVTSEANVRLWHPIETAPDLSRA
jgi:hypothetical protein